jgi:hypothetical protein
MLAETTVQAPAPRPEQKRRAEERKRAGALAEAGREVPCWEKIPGLQADPAAKASFVRVPFQIEVRGTFHQLMRYFWMIHEHANAGRIITVEDMGLSEVRAGADGITMTAKFTAVGFREPDDANPPAEATGDAAKGGKGQVREATQRREAQVEAASQAAAPPSAEAPVAPAAQAAAPAGESVDQAQRGVDRISKPEAP